MSVSENFVGVVIITIVVLMGWMIIQTNNINQSINLAETNEIFYQQEKLNNDISVILKTTEPITNLTIEKIIGDLVYSRTTKINHAEQEINMKDYIERYLDSIFGKENYYLLIQPPLDRVRLIYVIDGSQTMQEHIEFIRNMLPELKINIQELYGSDRDLIVETKIYLLQGPREHDLSCEKMEMIDDCFDIPLAYEIGGLNNNQIFEIPDSNDLYTKYFSETIKNPLSEFFPGFIKNTEFPKGMSYEDWATGVAFVAKHIEERSIDNPEDPTMTIIIPISDEPTSGAEANKCFDLDNFFVGMPFIKCSLCAENDDESKERANKFLSHAINVLRDYDYLVFPMAMQPGHILPNPIINSLSPCNAYDSERGVHGSEDIRSFIINQMQQIADATGGQVLDFSDIEDDEIDESLLLDVFSEVIGNLTNLEFGTKKENIERFSIRRVFPLGNNSLANLTIWVYREREFHDILTFEAINLKPVPIIYTSENWGESPLNIFIDGRASWDPNASYPLMLEWKIIDNISKTIIYENDTNTHFEFEFSAPRDEIRTFDINLVVTDSTGLSASTTRQITISNTEPKMQLYVISIEDNHPDFEFRANLQTEQFLKNIDCRDEIKVVYISPEQLTCPESFIGCENTISNFDPNYNKNRDRIAAFRVGNFWGGAAAGYTRMGANVVFSTSNPNRKEVLAHELGHTYYACEEYNTSWWIQQDISLRRNGIVGGCINDFPKECGFDSTRVTGSNYFLGKAPTNINFVDGFCTGNSLGLFGSRLQHTLNCNDLATTEQNNIMLSNTCGNNIIDPQETVTTCFLDNRSQLLYDCPGSPVYNDFGELVGFSAMGGPLPTAQTFEHFYVGRMKDTINEMICGDN